MKVKINKDKCIGCGSCVNVCGEVFEMGGDNKSKVKADPAGHEAEVKMARDACPTQAIEVEE